MLTVKAGWNRSEKKAAHNALSANTGQGRNMLEWITPPPVEPETEFVTSCDGLLITGQNGIVAGTHVASNLGWRAVDQLSVGDKVLTFDHGMKTITDIQRETLWSAQHSHLPSSVTPVLVPRDALNNRCDLWLMPEQGLLIECDAALDVLGDPFAVVPAEALVGFRGIERHAPTQRLDMTVLSFAGDEVVYVEGGLLAHCPRPRDILLEGADAGGGLYDVLDATRGRLLVECLMDQKARGALVYDADEVMAVT